MSKNTVWSVVERGMATNGGKAICRQLRDNGNDPEVRRVALKAMRDLAGGDPDGLDDLATIEATIRRVEGR